MNRKLLECGDLWSGLVLAGLGVYIVMEALNWVYSGPDGPGPGFFPIWYGIVMVLLSAVLVVSSVLRKSSGEAHGVKWVEAGRALGTWLALAISIALLKVLGFVLSFALLCFAIIKFLYAQSALRAVIIAVAYAVGFYLLFDLALGIELPAGWLGF